MLTHQQKNLLKRKHISEVSKKNRQPACAYTMNLHCYVIQFHTASQKGQNAFICAYDQQRYKMKTCAYSKHKTAIRKIIEIGPWTQCRIVKNPVWYDQGRRPTVQNSVFHCFRKPSRSDECTKLLAVQSSDRNTANIFTHSYLHVRCTN